MALDGTMTVPGIGPTKKIYVVAGGAAVALIGAYAYYRHAQAAGVNDTTAADASTADPYAGTGTDGTDAYTGAYGSISGTSGSDYYDSLTATPTTDQEWVALVETDLNYLEPDYVVATLGKYLAKQGLTTDEATLVRSAWAVAGHPPGGQVIIAAAAATPATPVTPGAVTGLKASRIDKGGVSLDWNPVTTTGVVGYRAYVGTGQSGNTVAYSNAYVPLQKTGTKYSISVAAVNSKGTVGPKTTISVTTKK